MQIPENQAATSTEYHLPPGQSGIPLNSTERAVRNLAIHMLWDLTAPMNERLSRPHDAQLGQDCFNASRSCISRLIDTLNPSYRSTLAGNVRDASYSEAERICGLSVASMCATLDPSNAVAWSMIYQLLPNQSAQILVQTTEGPQAVDRRCAERTMFAMFGQHQRNSNA